MQNFHLGDVAFCSPCKYVPSCIMPRSGPSSSGVNIGGDVGCDTSIIGNLHFVGQNPSKILSNFGHYTIVSKKLLFTFLFFQSAFARESAVSVARHSLHHRCYMLPSLLLYIIVILFFVP